MTALSVIQVNADRGIAPGTTKGAALHLRGVAAGLESCGHSVVTYSARAAEGSFPTEVRPLDRLDVPTIAEADMVYERYALGHRTGLELARAAGVRFVLEVNAPLVAEATTHRPYTVTDEMSTIEQELLTEADLVITVSSELRRWVDEVRVGPTITISNGFEPAWFPAAADSRTVQNRLVFIGHPKPWHGADQLPRLLFDLGRHGITPELLLIGGGPGVDAVRSEAERYGVTPQLRITGPLAPMQASQLLATASIGLAPYPAQQTFYFCPLKIVDYLAAGLAIVSTNQGDVATLVADSGIVVRPDDPNAFCDAVKALLTDSDRRQAMGLTGRRRAMATMTWSQVAERTITAISELGYATSPAGRRL